MATYYRWRRSTVQHIEQQTSGASFRSLTAAGFSVKNSKPTITESYQYNFSSPDARYSGSSVVGTNLSGKWVALGDGGYEDSVLLANGPISDSGNGYLSVPGTRYSYVETAGVFVDYVYSTSSSAYPNGGVSGSYYYDQRASIINPRPPTDVTYPNPITTSPVTVNWLTAGANITEYPVKRYEVDFSINGGVSWGFAGDKTHSAPGGGYPDSLDVTIPAGATSIQFRVRAQDSNYQWSDYATGPEAQVLLAPTLTVPQMVMQGQQATISWSAIEGADSYTLQRKANTDADWTQVYSGANLSYSETVGTWTSVQYRVQAVFSGTPGGWAESAAIPVVSSSALVISGTDGDLGTVVNDISYSISTDTGNQITATITVNSAVIFSGNVGNSTSDTIPVLDLVNGEGTIVIEASVQASGGPVSAVRTWTYTKTLITFPNAGSVAQLTKEGENIFPKTLAECVRLPGGKTLDQVTGFPAQVYAGSYVGTGTYGQSNPNSLTFPFEPKFLFIATGITSSTSSLVGFLIWVNASEQASVIFPPVRNNAPESLGVQNHITFTQGETWINWYAPPGFNGGKYQMNNNGTTYYYIALG